ncbi:MAG: YdcF family protein [Gemmatimonadota bacterium]|nr:YdcF family protein [Gemmatimonadota bacterium]
MKRAAKLVIGLLVVGFVAYTVALIYVLVVSQQDERNDEADAIVVLGAAQYNGRPSPVLRARLDHAFRLYREGLDTLIIVTGGIGRGDRFSEAQVSRSYLIARGVPPENIVALHRGSSTEETMTEVAEWLHPRGADRVLLVSDPFHMARLKLEARRTRLDASVSPTGTSPISDNPNLELEYLFREGFKVPVALVRSLEWLQPSTTEVR